MSCIMIDKPKHHLNSDERGQPAMSATAIHKLFSSLFLCSLLTLFFSLLCFPFSCSPLFSFSPTPLSRSLSSFAFFSRLFTQISYATKNLSRCIMRLHHYTNTLWTRGEQLVWTSPNYCLNPASVLPCDLYNPRSATIPQFISWCNSSIMED